jgi:hypothetical protein
MSRALAHTLVVAILAALLFVAFIVLLLAEALELAPAPQVRVSVGSVRPDSERNA